MLRLAVLLLFSDKKLWRQSVESQDVTDVRTSLLQWDCCKHNSCYCYSPLEVGSICRGVSLNSVTCAFSATIVSGSEMERSSSDGWVVWRAADDYCILFRHAMHGQCPIGPHFLREDLQQPTPVSKEFNKIHGRHNRSSSFTLPPGFLMGDVGGPQPQLCLHDAPSQVSLRKFSGMGTLKLAWWCWWYYFARMREVKTWRRLSKTFF